MRSLLLAFALLLPASAYCDTKVALPKADDVVKTVGIVQLRAASPDPTFGGKGAQIDWLKSGETIKVLSVKHYISVFGTEVWLEVERKSNPGSKGWIDAGLAKDFAKGSAHVTSAEHVESAESRESAMAAKMASEARARTDELIENEE